MYAYILYWLGFYKLRGLIINHKFCSIWHQSSYSPESHVALTPLHAPNSAIDCTSLESDPYTSQALYSDPKRDSAYCAELASATNHIPTSLNNN